MSRRRWIAFVDRRDGGLHEALERVLDLIVQICVLDRDRGMAGEGVREAHLATRIRQDVAIRGRLVVIFAIGSLLRFTNNKMPTTSFM